MKIILVALALLVSCSKANAQEKDYTQKELDQIAISIQEKGLILYRSEAASMYGTQVFLSKFKGNKSSIGGYFSYPDRLLTTCVIYSADNMPSVIATVTFDTSFFADKSRLKLTKRPFTALEQQYFTLKKKAVTLMMGDTVFKSYDKTQPSIVPLIHGGKKEVYVITTTTEQGIIVLGNDYLIEFDNANNVKNRVLLHKGLIVLNYSPESNKEGSMHMHHFEYSPFMAPTEICTTKLWAPYTRLTKLTTLSEKYKSVWTGEHLTISPKKAP